MKKLSIEIELSELRRAAELIVPFSSKDSVFELSEYVHLKIEENQTIFTCINSSAGIQIELPTETIGLETENYTVCLPTKLVHSLLVKSGDSNSIVKFTFTENAEGKPIAKMCIEEDQYKINAISAKAFPDPDWNEKAKHQFTLDVANFTQNVGLILPFAEDDKNDTTEGVYFAIKDSIIEMNATNGYIFSNLTADICCEEDFNFRMDKRSVENIIKALDNQSKEQNMDVMEVKICRTLMYFKLNNVKLQVRTLNADSYINYKNILHFTENLKVGLKINAQVLRSELNKASLFSDAVNLDIDPVKQNITIKAFSEIGDMKTQIPISSKEIKGQPVAMRCSIKYLLTVIGKHEVSKLFCTDFSKNSAPMIILRSSTDQYKEMISFALGLRPEGEPQKAGETK